MQKYRKKFQTIKIHKKRKTKRVPLLLLIWKVEDKTAKFTLNLRVNSQIESLPST